MKRIHVVAGILHANDKILIAKRPDDKHQGGKWEFPGGKVELNEEPFLALQRELQEELNVMVTQAQSSFSIQHDYSDKQILLDVWTVSAFEGEAEGYEGQEIRWVSLNELANYPFPAANQAILDHLQTGS